MLMSELSLLVKNSEVEDIECCHLLSESYTTGT